MRNAQRSALTRLRPQQSGFSSAQSWAEAILHCIVHSPSSCVLQMAKTLALCDTKLTLVPTAARWMMFMPLLHHIARHEPVPRSLLSCCWLARVLCQCPTIHNQPISPSIHPFILLLLLLCLFPLASTPSLFQPRLQPWPALQIAYS